MIWTDIAFALLIGLIVATVFVPLLGWRRPDDTIGDEIEEGAAGWGAAFLFFFLVVFLFTLAAGLWLEPVGPVAWGVPWLGFLFIGILVALLLAAAAPPPRRGPRPMEGTDEQLDDARDPADPGRRIDEGEAGCRPKAERKIYSGR